MTKSEFMLWLNANALNEYCCLKDSYSKIPYTIGCVFDPISGFFDVYETNERGGHDSLKKTKDESIAYNCLLRVIKAKCSYDQCKRARRDKKDYSLRDGHGPIQRMAAERACCL